MIEKKRAEAILFNSHPHKEDDQRGFDNQAVMNFSTHILTRRMTHAIFMQFRHYFFNSHPHKEDDLSSENIQWFIVFSTHILTRRMTGLSHDIGRTSGFSTHILTRRMTAILNKNTLSKTARIIPFEYNTLKIYIFSNSYLLFFWKSTPFSSANLPEDFCALIIRTKISKYP